MSVLESRRKCAKCNITAAEGTELRFHRFPLPGKQTFIKARVWAEFCYPEKDWSNKESLIALYKQHKMLCSKHFDKSCYTSNTTEKLNIFAIPTEAHDILRKLRQELKVFPSEIVNSNIPVAQGASHLDLSLPSTSREGISSNTIMSKELTISKGILKELDLNKTAQLTPKKQKLYKRCRKNISEILRLRRRFKKKPRSLLPELSQNENFKSLTEKKLTGSFALLLQSQLKNSQRKLTGRRWSMDEKVMALSIFKRNSGCYRLLRRMFCLPSETSLKRLLNRIPMRCGINSQIFGTIKEITEKREMEENLCILAFDEMSLRKNFTYNQSQDLIEGFQDHGKQGRSLVPATHSLLFMAIGIRKSWKQPLAFYFSGDCVTSERLCALIKEVLEASFQAGLIVVATVCDNFGVNIKTLNSLGSTVEKPYFEYKGNEIVTILDPPHLLKCFRNNFLKYDIKCTQEIQNDGKPITGVAKWSHIKEFYEKDNKNPNFVFAPALTKQHIEPNFKQKMKVSLACQVLSHSVAAGLLAKIANM